MSAPKPVRVLLVDDHQAFLECATQFLHTLPRIEVVGKATSGEEALELVTALRPDLVLMDIQMRGMTGLAATARIKRLSDAPKVVVLTMHTLSEFRLLAEKANADGFLQKIDLVAGLPPLLAAFFPPGTASGEEPAEQG